MNGKRNPTPLTDEQREFAAAYSEMPKWALKRHMWAVKILGPDEAFSVAQVALIYAARKFDVTRGFAPTTYIAKVIFRSLNQACQRASSHAKPEPLVRLNNGVEYIPDELVSREDPTPKLDPDEIESIKSAMRFLGAKKREIVERHYFGGETMAEIGRSFGVSRTRVDQIKEDAIACLKRRLRIATDGGVCEVRA